MTVPATVRGSDGMVTYFHMIKTRNIDEFLNWYADDVAFANTPPARGKPASGPPSASSK
jgi:hypothetical protein